jgi:hypothetical protein
MRKTGIYDFFLVTDDYRLLYPDAKQQFLCQHLPPSVYYLELESEKFGKLCAKYSVISLDRLRQETSPQASDNYHMGRFGQKIGICYVKDDAVRTALIDAFFDALIWNVRLTIHKFHRDFPFEGFFLKYLRTSYSGATRIETEEKFQSIYANDKGFYDSIYRKVLCYYEQETGEIRYNQAKDLYELQVFGWPRFSNYLRARFFLNKSKCTSTLRWFKNMLTFKNWLDYIINKVERHSGVKLELTRLDRKFPLIIGSRHFFRLLFKGHLR